MRMIYGIKDSRFFCFCSIDITFLRMDILVWILERSPGEVCGRKVSKKEAQKLYWKQMTKPPI